MNLEKAESLEFVQSCDELKELVNAWKALKEAQKHGDPASWKKIVDKLEEARGHLESAKKRNERFKGLAGLVENYIRHGANQPEMNRAVMTELQDVFAMATGFEAELTGISRQVKALIDIPAWRLGAEAAASGKGLSFSQIRDSIAFAIGDLEKVIVLLAKAIKWENRFINNSGR
ncbi:hypothetical protein HYU16_02405 [Candidatus Woesearchaeota archaeon]|nr:hypothetical protein [Candidatus Woesearchaeota archaeon]